MVEKDNRGRPCSLPEIRRKSILGELISYGSKKYNTSSKKGS